MQQAVHWWLSTYERLVKSQKFFSSYLTQEDMSRFGRNYLEVGFYTEILFPKKQIRFIAINNSVDSDKPQDNDFTPFLNIMNEWYAKDTSNKISRALLPGKCKEFPAFHEALSPAFLPTLFCIFRHFPSATRFWEDHGYS